MKRIQSRFILILSALLLLTAFFAALPASAASERVIYVCDGGKGDGSSPESPLAAAAPDLKEVGTAGLPLGNPLYRALLALRDTGGTVVVTGKLTVRESDSSSSDFSFPIHGDNTIKITSVYNGVDYRLKGAKIAYQRNLCLGGSTVFENVTFSMDRNNLRIACEGYPAVFGEGIECTHENGYPTLVGGGRFLQTYGRDIDLTVLSGTWDTIVGGGYGVAGDTEDDFPFGTHVGNLYLTLGGSASIKNYLYCTGISSNAPTIGNAFITINDGSYAGSFLGTGLAGTVGNGYKVFLDINGGTFSFKELTGVKVGTGKDAPKAILDLGDYTGSVAAFAGAKAFDTVIYPNKYITKVEVLTPPTNPTVGKNTGVDLAGASFRVTYSIRGADTVFDYEYSEIAHLLSVENTDESGKISLSLGGFAFDWQGDAASLPALRLEGAQIKTGGVFQGLRFIASLEKTDVKITDRGILILPSDALHPGEILRKETVFGALDVSSTDSLLFEREGKEYFGGAVTAIQPEEYGREYTAVAYYDYEIDGRTGRVYSNELKRSVSGIVEEMKTASRESASTLLALSNTVGKTAEEGVTFIRPQAVIDSIRKKVTDSMMALGEIEWVNGVKMDYTDGPIEYTAPVYSVGKTYRGLVYGPGKSTVEEWAAGLNASGRFMASKTPDFNDIASTSCSHSIFSAYQLITTESIINGAMKALPCWGLGTIPVGDLVKTDSFGTTESIILGTAKNRKDAEQFTYRAYATLTEGDFLLKWWINGNGVSLGHTIMCASEPVLVYNNDGTISQNSYIIVNEQQSSLIDFGSYFSTWRLHKKWTFGELFGQFFVPLSVDALKTGYVETPWCVLTDLPSADKIAEKGFGGRLTSNYRIRSYTVSLLDESGKSVFSGTAFPHESTACPIDGVVTAKTVSSLKPGTYCVEVTVSFATKTETVRTVSFVKA